MVVCCVTVYWLGVFVACVMVLVADLIFSWLLNSVVALRCCLLLCCLGIAV